MGPSPKFYKVLISGRSVYFYYIDNISTVSSAGFKVHRVQNQAQALYVCTTAPILLILSSNSYQDV